MVMYGIIDDPLEETEFVLQGNHKIGGKTYD